MTPKELKEFAQSLMAELRASENLAVGGVSLRRGSGATSCTCDGRCTCNEQCACNSKGDCGCNSRCPCDSKSIPAEVEWLINPDPTMSRAIAILNGSESPKEMLATLQNIEQECAPKAQQSRKNRSSVWGNVVRTPSAQGCGCPHEHRGIAGSEFPRDMVRGDSRSRPRFIVLQAKSRADIRPRNGKRALEVRFRRRRFGLRRSKTSPGNCARRRGWRVSGAIRASAMRLASFSLRSTARFTEGFARATSRRRRPCSTSLELGLDRVVPRARATRDAAPMGQPGASFTSSSSAVGGTLTRKASTKSLFAYTAAQCARRSASSSNFQDDSWLMVPVSA